MRPSSPVHFKGINSQSSELCHYVGNAPLQGPLEKCRGLHVVWPPCAAPSPGGSTQTRRCSGGDPTNLLTCVSAAVPRAGGGSRSQNHPVGMTLVLSDRK